MKIKMKSSGFTMIELLIALVCAAMLMTAVGAAFDASATNYTVNENIYRSTNMARQALQRLTLSIRTADSVALPSYEANNFCSMITKDGKDYTYEYRSSDNALYLTDNSTTTEYKLCDNVNSMTFTKSTGDLDGVTVVKDVRISMEVNIGDESKTLNAAAVVRRNIY